MKLFSRIAIPAIALICGFSWYGTDKSRPSVQLAQRLEVSGKHVDLPRSFAGSTVPLDMASVPQNASRSNVKSMMRVNDWRKVHSCRLQLGMVAASAPIAPDPACAGLDAAALLKEEQRKVYEAALGGDRVAQVAYIKFADDYGFTPERLMTADSEAQAYMQAAARFLMQSAEAGDEEAITLAAGAYKVGLLVPKDLSRAYAYETVLIMLQSKNASSQELGRLEKLMKPGELSIGKALGNEMFERFKKD